MQTSRAAWKIEADTLPGMNFDSYRASLIHETPAIKELLGEARGEHFIISAPKGFGKTLLLIAKRKQLDEQPGYLTTDLGDGESSKISGVVHVGGEILDRPNGSFPALNKTRMNEFKSDYHLWTEMWSVCITIAAIKVNLRQFPKELESNKLKCDLWTRDVLLDGEIPGSPAQIFVNLLNEDYSTRQRVLASSHTLDSLFRAIRAPIAFFIDNVDEYFEPILENQSIDAADSREANVRNKSNDVWVLGQLGLVGASYKFHKVNSHVKVYCTVRREAFVRLHEYTSEHNQIIGCTVEIKYERRDLQQIFEKHIRMMSKESLFEAPSGDSMTLLFGSASRELKHRFVDQCESAFDYVLRHTFYRPRDLVTIGQSIAAIPIAERNEERIKETVEANSGDLVRGLLSEMRPFFVLPSIGKLLKLVEKNVLTSDELDKIAQAYVASLSDEQEMAGKLKDEYAHPFCVLYKIGMIGWIETTHGPGRKARQRFIKPREIEIRNHVGLPVTEGFYLVHPALDQMVFERAGGEYLRQFHRSNVIGGDLEWTEPVTSHFVLKGDVCGFSEVMGTELYRAVAKKLHEWAEATCKDLEYFEISGGDSILMIDRSPDLVVRSAMAFLERAKAYKNHPLELRFGGAAGPIMFEEVKRRVEGKWQKLTYPIGLALRTSARIEPHAPKGAIMVESSFAQYSAEYADKLLIREVSVTNVPSLTYEQAKDVFLVRKNPLDPAYETKLYNVELAN